MKDEKFENLIEYIKSELIDKNWEKAIFTIGIGIDKSRGGKLRYFIDNIEFKKVLSIFKYGDFLDQIFYEFDNGLKTWDFNKVIINIAPNEYSIEYSLDAEKIKEQKRANAKVFSNWIYENIRNRIFDFEKENDLLPWIIDSDGEKEYLNSWEKGVFSFKLYKDKLIDHKIELYYDGQWRKCELPIPEYIINSILEHHRITHQELKEEWKEWNRFVVRAPTQFIPLGKEHEYIKYKKEK